MSPRRYVGHLGAVSVSDLVRYPDFHPQEAARKRALRAQRFNLSPPEADPGLVKLQARAQRFGVRLVARDNQPFKLEKRCA